MQSAKMNYFVDTNLLVYAIDPREQKKRRHMAGLLRRLVESRALVLSPQSLGEFYRTVTERHRLMPVSDARAFIQILMPSCTAPYDLEVMARAFLMQDTTNFGWWDCMLLAAAAVSGCSIFLSEDMQHGRAIDGLTIVNPFKSPADLLE
jgi:predicted nucleic acid-binding protein